MPYVSGNKITCIGTLSEIEPFVEFLKSIDTDLFDQFKVSFIVSKDAFAAVDKLKNIISFADSAILTHVSIIPVSENVLVAVSRVSKYIDMVNSLSKMLSGYLDIKNTFYDIDIIYRTAEESYAFIKNHFPDLCLTYDNQNNKLYMKGTLAEYEAMVSLLEDYDIMPRQIHVNLYLVDLKSSNSFDMGTDWFVSTDNFGVDQSELIYPLTGGINTILTIGDIQQFFSVLEKNFDARIISRPNIYLKSGQTAKISLGSSVPFVSSKSETNTSNGLIQNVEYRDIGIIFEISAEIAENHDIIFDVSIENSSMQDKAGVEDNPIFTQDSIQTKFVMRDRSLCILGGIKSDEREEVVKGIPFINKLPLLKYVFGTTSRSREGREMLICIAPTVLGERETDRVSREILEHLFIRGEKGHGSEGKREVSGDIPHQHERREDVNTGTDITGSPYNGDRRGNETYDNGTGLSE